MFFFCFAEAPPKLGEAKWCKPSAKQKKNKLFFCFAEAPPNLGEAKWCKPNAKV